MIELDQIERGELERFVRSQYDVVVQQDRFGPIELDIFALRDPDVLLDEATLSASHHQMNWQPYWGKVWSASLGLAEELSRFDWQGQNVLDLGCGLGIPGSVAAARGGNVVLADNAVPALQFARLNSWPWRDRVRVERVDWHASTLDLQFDLIIGSDIIYDRDDLASLDRFWRRHLAESGRLWLGDPNRLLTLDLLPELTRRGWSIARRQVEREAGKPVNVFELTPVDSKKREFRP